MAASNKARSSKPRNALTATYVRSLFTYNRKTGVLHWKKNASIAHNKYRGKIAGFETTNGYLYVSINKKWYLVHRIAHLHVTGKWPREKMDHRFHKRTDNRWNKIREATASQNGCNQRKSNRNTSGFKGVSWHSQRKKWRAQIVVLGQHHSLGCYSTKQKAHAAYRAASHKLHGAFARVN